MSTAAHSETTSHPATYAPSAETVARAHVDAAKYDQMYAASIADPEGFWSEQARRVDWIKPFSQVKDVDFTLGNVHINWFADGSLNVAANCIDRHLATRGEQTAILWEPDDPNDAAQHITYAELHRNVSKMANVLKALGIGKGDRLCHAGLRPDRCHSLGGICGLFARRAWRTGQRL